MGRFLANYRLYKFGFNPNIGYLACMYKYLVSPHFLLSTVSQLLSLPPHIKRGSAKLPSLFKSPYPPLSTQPAYSIQTHWEGPNPEKYCGERGMGWLPLPPTHPDEVGPRRHCFFPTDWIYLLRNGMGRRLFGWKCSNDSMVERKKKNFFCYVETILILENLAQVLKGFNPFFA